jgi:hypothetical protein
MAHVRLPEGIPGSLELVAFSPETAKSLTHSKERFVAGPTA